MPWNKIPLLDLFLLPLPQMKFKSHESEKKYIYITSSCSTATVFSEGMLKKRFLNPWMLWHEASTHCRASPEPKHLRLSFKESPSDTASCTVRYVYQNYEEGKFG